MVRNHTACKAGLDWRCRFGVWLWKAGWGLVDGYRYRLPAAAPVIIAAASVAKPSAVAPVAKSQAQEPIKPVPVMPQAEPKASNSPEGSLAEQGAAHFTIQLLLASASTPAALDAFIEEASGWLPAMSCVYRSLRRQGNEYVGVVYVAVMPIAGGARGNGGAACVIAGQSWRISYLIAGVLPEIQRVDACAAQAR